MCEPRKHQDIVHDDRASSDADEDEPNHGVCGRCVAGPSSCSKIAGAVGGGMFNRPMNFALPAMFKSADFAAVRAAPVPRSESLRASQHAEQVEERDNDEESEEAPSGSCAKLAAWRHPVLFRYLDDSQDTLSRSFKKLQQKCDVAALPLPGTLDGKNTGDCAPKSPAVPSGPS